MLKFDLIDDNVNYIILKDKKYLDEENKNELKVKGTNYKKLTNALLKRISENQKNEITQNNNIIFFNDLTRCFSKILTTTENCDDSTNCICGVDIDYNFKIINHENNECYTIGSTCIKNWEFSNDEKRLMKKEDIDKLYFFSIKGILKLNAVNALRNYYVNQPLMNGEPMFKNKKHLSD